MPFETVPLGVRFDGTPFWGYLGGAEGDDPDDDDLGDEGGSGGDGGEGGNGSLGEGGREALDRLRGDLKQARDGLRPWRSLAKDLGVRSPDEIRTMLTKRTQDEQKHADDLRRRDSEVLGKANARILRSEIRALAADVFADPQDAVLNLNLDDYEVDDEGSVPERRIKADLADLLKRKPHLAKVSKRLDPELGPRGRAPQGKGNDMNALIRRAAGR
jgi:hypothetical protein